MQEIKIKAPAKINLYLAVLGKRKDGFHNIESLMQAVSLFDNITLKERKKGIKLSSVSGGIPKGKTNLAYQAAELFLKKTALKKGVSIKLEKHIPAGAGLGGGSSDAAAVLCGLNKLWGLKLSKKKLINWAKELGSDVPFFIGGKTARVKGRGEKVNEVKVKKSFCFLLFFPGFSLSTAKVYKFFSGDRKRGINAHRGGIGKLCSALKKGEFDWVKKNLYNSLETAVFKLAPELLVYKRLFEQAGLEPVKVSGSGSSLFVPVKNAGTAGKLVSKLKLKEGVFLVKSLS